MKLKNLILPFMACISANLSAQNTAWSTTNNIGIGTTTIPVPCRLNVNVTLNTNPPVGTVSIPLRIERSGTNTPQNNALDIYFTSNPLAGLNAGGGSTIFQTSSATGDMIFLPKNATGTNGQWMAITETGKLTLGTHDLTTDPWGKINVKVDNTAGNTAGIVSVANNTNDWRYNLRLEVNRDKTKSISSYNSSTSKETFTVFGNGTTWIGEHTPSGQFSGAMLSVDGMLVAKEIFVQSSNWADYVFDDNYALMPLDSLERYLLENNHLPNVPTTEEVKENGSNLAETNKILLEKVEELTLYLLQLNKEVEALKNGQTGESK